MWVCKYCIDRADGEVEEKTIVTIDLAPVCFVCGQDREPREMRLISQKVAEKLKSVTNAERCECVMDVQTLISVFAGEMDNSIDPPWAKPRAVGKDVVLVAEFRSEQIGDSLHLTHSSGKKFVVEFREVRDGAKGR